MIFRGRGNWKILTVNYNLTCEECNSIYIGTTTRSAYIRGKEHEKDLNKKDENSDMWRHCEEKHGGEIMNFRMDVIDTFKEDPMLRQVTESVRISRTDKNILINRKEEYRPTRRR